MQRYRGEQNYKEILVPPKKIKRKIIGISILLCILLLIGVATFPNIKLAEKHQKIIYGEKYKETKYKAGTLFTDLNQKVKISDDVDVNKVGKYKVKYQVKYLFWNKTVTRDIEVIDQEKPVLTLADEKEIVLCPKANIENYKVNYKATDNYDGDITDQVNIKEENGKLMFSISDSSENMTTVTRNIKREDKERPSIALKGKIDHHLKVGQTYKEEGFTATDNCDGNLNDNVKINSNVNFNRAGVYKIEYSVIDLSKNKTTVVRNIIVGDKNVPANKGDGKIYLTFDDGPSKTITPKVLDILKEENVKATFFVVNHSSSLDYLIKRAHSEGHTVALHSYTHNYKQVYSSKNAYLNDLEKIGAKVKRLTGVDSKIIRFPGGSSNTISRRYQKGIMSYLVKEVANRGYRYYDWNIGSGDAGEVKTKEGVYKNVTRNLGHNKTNIVLMHDFENNHKTLNALKDIIKYGKSNGYQFEAININTPQIKHGVNN